MIYFSFICTLALSITFGDSLIFLTCVIQNKAVEFRMPISLYVNLHITISFFSRIFWVEFLHDFETEIDFGKREKWETKWNTKTHVGCCGVSDGKPHIIPHEERDSGYFKLIGNVKFILNVQS